MPPNEQPPLDGSDLIKEYGITLTTVADTKICVILLGSDGIIYMRYRPNSSEGLADFMEYYEQLRQNLRSFGAKVGALVNLNDLALLTKEARKAHTQPDVLGMYYAIALVAHSPMAQAVGGFAIFLGRPSIPMRLFGTEAEAREWLLKKKQGLDDVEDTPL